MAGDAPYAHEIRLPRLGSSTMAALGMTRYAFLTGEDPSDDGPRALVAEFLGYWVGGFFLLWSFFVPDRRHQWILRGVAAFGAIVSIYISTHFAATDEVEETPEKEPTGSKNDTTDLHLE
jgi:hypothetical protein